MWRNSYSRRRHGPFNLSSLYSSLPRPPGKNPIPPPNSSPSHATESPPPSSRDSPSPLRSIANASQRILASPNELSAAASGQTPVSPQRSPIARFVSPESLRRQSTPSASRKRLHAGSNLQTALSADPPPSSSSTPRRRRVGPHHPRTHRLRSLQLVSEALQLWRICRARYAETAFSGEGAFLYSARWNLQGVRVVYTAISLALAALESFEVDEEPSDLVSTSVILSANLGIHTVHHRALPSGWNQLDQSSTQEIGAEWIQSGRSVALKVPSVVVDGEWNVLLNPAHRDFPQIARLTSKSLALRPRMFQRKP